MERKQGYYWVKRTRTSDFEIAYFDYRNWFRTGFMNVYADSDFYEIDEERLKKNDLTHF